MIALISKYFESTTSEVVDWLQHFKVSYVRLNSDREDLFISNFSLEIGDETEKIKYEKDSLRDFHTIWYRRSNELRNLDLESIIEEKYRQKLMRSFKLEKEMALFGIYSIFNNKYWLSHPFNSHLNKLYVLKLAVDYEITVPNTLVSDQSYKLSQFLDRYPRAITKPLYNPDFVNIENNMFTQYTAPLFKDEVSELPEKIFPSLVQEQISKKYEIRSFYLEEEFYSMAIFSQGDQQTEVDFRRYNKEKPNRTVPYQLPKNVEKKLIKLMKALKLNTGSIDLIKSTNGEYVFLEVNPVGQFGMVSKPCNYYLERKIAQLLHTKDQLAQEHE